MLCRRFFNSYRRAQAIMASEGCQAVMHDPAGANNLRVRHAMNEVAAVGNSQV